MSRLERRILHLILTDSLSSLLALRSFSPRHPFVHDILSRLTSLDQAGKSVQFCWVPSHVGIAGNERADVAARRAASAPHTRRLPLSGPWLFTLQLVCSCTPSGRVHGMHSHGINSGSLSPLWSLGNLAYVKADAKKSSCVGCASAIRTAHTVTSFEARRGRCAWHVMCPSQSPTSYWRASGTLESVQATSDAFPPQPLSSTSLETIHPGSRTTAFSPLSVI